MIKIDTGGYIIDTPGIKGFGIIDMTPQEISHYFPKSSDFQKIAATTIACISTNPIVPY